MSVKRRKFSKEFKLHLIGEVRSGKSQASVARQYQLRPPLLNKWISELETYGDEAFAGEGNSYTPAAREAALRRKVEQLQAENDLLKKALTQLDAIRTLAPASGDEL